FEERMVAGDFGHPFETKIVFRPGVLSIIRLQETHEVGRIIIPEAGGLCIVCEILLQSVVRAVSARHRKVTGQDVVERRNIGRSLDRSVPAQSKDSASWPADVAQQQLQN